jgi:hypothetical protein
MNNNVNLLEIFYLTDEFCKESDKTTKGYRLPSQSSKKQRNKPSAMSGTEVITILVAFHLGGFRNLKHFYLYYVQRNPQPATCLMTQYHRLITLIPHSFLSPFPFLLTPLKVCSISESSLSQ